MTGRLQLATLNAIRRRGTTATLRTVTKAGTPALPNPPTLVAPVLAADAPAGSTTISINASSAYGRIIAGDVLAIGMQEVTVAAPVISRPNTAGSAGFDGVTFTPALTADEPAGTPINPAWSADLGTWCVINSFPLNLVDGELIQIGDIRATMPAIDGFDPKLTWKLIAGGFERTIINLAPNYVRDVIVSWVAQAR